MEEEIKIKDIEENYSNFLKEKIKQYNTYLFICCVLIIIIFFSILFTKRDSDRAIKKIHHYDYLIVGSGLYGAVFNYLAKISGKTTIVVEKRDVIGGNLYCDKIEGIYAHKYGPHIFHTDNKKVWDFVNNLTHFNPFKLQIVSKVKEKLYSLPFNMWTFNQLWGIVTPKQAKDKIDEDKYYGKIHNLEEQIQSLIGKDIYEKLIKGYIEKQWGKKCKKLSPNIIKNLPIRFNFDNNYFIDRYQGIPEGCYNSLFEQLLKDTEVIKGTDYNKNKGKYEKIADRIVYTGKIDEYFNYKLGKLAYRSVRWDNEIKNISNFQASAIVNYPEKDKPYTRIIEYKHFEPNNKEIKEIEKTVISKEFTEEWDETKEGYYPINDKKNNNLYKQYKKMADKESKVIFGGRLAEYKNYNMNDIIEAVFKIWNY